LTNSRIVVGVSDETLLVNKTLGELIEPLEVRMRNVAEFIEDIKPGRWGQGGSVEIASLLVFLRVGSMYQNVPTPNHIMGP
jgi:hypothetical protein